MTQKDLGWAEVIAKRIAQRVTDRITNEVMSKYQENECDMRSIDELKKQQEIDPQTLRGGLPVPVTQGI